MQARVSIQLRELLKKNDWHQLVTLLEGLQTDEEKNGAEVRPLTGTLLVADLVRARRVCALR